MADRSDFLRYASPNEQRTISRENLNFYHAVIIGALYDIPSNVDVRTPKSFYSPLKKCIDQHPFLSVIVKDADMEKSSFQHVPSMNLDDHIVIANDTSGGDPLKEIERLLSQHLDTPFPPNIPPWKIVILPLPRTCFIAFCFSHSIGDGVTGLAFHRAFLPGWRTPSKPSDTLPSTIQVPLRAFPPPFDTPQHLPISWSYLLRPLLALLIPTFLSKALGLRVSASTINEGTWTGATVATTATPVPPSKIVLRRVSASTLTSALKAARTHDVKLTGLFLHLVARALGTALPEDPGVTNFVSQTAVNMRRALGISDDLGGNFPSACYILHPRQPPSSSSPSSSSAFTEADWQAARSATQKLAATAATVQDQAVGLLRYLPSMRMLTLGKLGQRRDCSFEVSNIGVFSSEGDEEDGGDIRVKEVVFAQPGQFFGAPLAFNVVSVKGGDLMYSVTWKEGGLGVGDGKMEDEVVERICEGVEKGLAELQ